MKLLLTACGCPGASTLIRYLKLSAKQESRELTIIGTDMDNEAIGRFALPKFYHVPAGSSPSYIEMIRRIIDKEEPDVLLPESSNEVMVLSSNRHRLNTQVMVSHVDPLRTAISKLEMYKALTLGGSSTRTQLPEYRVVRSTEDLELAAHDLGYPKKPVVIKPTIGKGSRGVRILDASINRADLLLNEKPVHKYMLLPDATETLSKAIRFPEMLVMEYLEGEEVATDVLCMDGRTLLTTVKTVEAARWGVIVRGELVDRPELVKATQQILEAIPLSYCVNLQFIGGKLIEINPRVSSFIYQDDLVLPWLGIKLAMGEITEEQVRGEQGKVKYGRRMTRYMDQVFHD